MFTKHVPTENSIDVSPITSYNLKPILYTCNMNQPLSALLLTLLVSIFACKSSPSKPKNAPISDFGHIDVVLDSATWYGIKNDSFIQSEFGVLDQYTTYYGGKPVTIYMY
jgi:hypothetical protein